MTQQPATVHPRFPLATTVMLRESNGNAVLAKIRNISLSGCYVETPRQLAENTRVRVILQTNDIHADVWGIVQRRDAEGLGLRFTNGATVEDWKRLESFIKELHSTTQARGTSAGV